MKISIAWAFDHIEADYRDIDVPALITQLNQTTAEVEGLQTIHVSLERFFGDHDFNQSLMWYMPIVQNCLKK